MKTNNLSRVPGGVLKKGKFLVAAVIGIALIILTGAFVRINGHPPTGQMGPAFQISTPSLTASTEPNTGKPQYHKKAPVFKRTLPESEDNSIRLSAMTEGYLALSVIPPFVVAPQVSVRLPRFPDSTALSNYQALSTLGTRQYYSNPDVQQYLSNLSSQQYLSELSNQLSWNNLENQQYLNNFNNNMANQQYLNNFNSLNSQQYLNNFNNNMANQQYLNNFNNLNSQQYLNNFNNNMANQQYLNNFNNLNTQQSMNNFNTYTSPTYIQPMQQFYSPPPIQPMPQFYSP